ncbi:MAG TPA: hypothetical protein VEH52_00880 [Gaiellaceae bacterium]|nr:hypothetical protein [Gaiellaceae bacterium]
MTDTTSFLTEPPDDSAVAAAYDTDVASGGYIKNYTRAWCWRPDVLSAYRALHSGLLDSSTLSPSEVAVIVAATAAARGDSYCSLAWGTRLAELRGPETAAQVVRGLEPEELSRREDALMTWSRQVVRDPNATTGADAECLREAGLDDREIFEATMLIGLRLMFSTINDALGVRPDRELVVQVPEPVREAVAFGRSPSPPA